MRRWRLRKRCWWPGSLTGATAEVALVLEMSKQDLLAFEGRAGMQCHLYPSRVTIPSQPSSSQRPLLVLTDSIYH